MGCLLSVGSSYGCDQKKNQSKQLAGMLLIFIKTKWLPIFLIGPEAFVRPVSDLSRHDPARGFMRGKSMSDCPG